MAYRQNSFFKEDTKPQHLRQRVWSNGSAPRDSILPSKSVPAMAPIAASSQSKSKLKAFQFHPDEGPEKEQVTVGGNVDKENESLSTDHRSFFQMNPPPQPSSQISATKEPRDCPQTPIGRLPLSELLASGDDARQNLVFTPRERVLWDNSPIDSDLTNPVPEHKKRKRAYSTSPLSSSQNEASAYLRGSKSAKDHEAARQALTTPKADPADDLWSRYSLNTDKRSPSAPKGLPLSRLIHSSSPQTPAAHLKSRGGSLRRAISCVEWPTSTAKRRKLDYNRSLTEAVRGLMKPVDAAENLKMTRVSLLVEKVHNGLSKPHETSGYCSSERVKSSPTGSSEKPSPRELSSSQQSNHVVDDVVNGLSQTVMADKTSQSKRLVLYEEDILDLNRAAPSSDIDDNDLDVGMLDADHTLWSSGTRNMNAAQQGTKCLNPTNLRLTSQSEANILDLRKGNHNLSEQRAEPEQLARTVTPNNESKELPQAHSDTDTDEFEDDADVSAADLEDVFAQYDTPRPALANAIGEYHKRQDDGKEQTSRHAATHEPKATRGPVATEVESLSSDDTEFGEDLDFEQIAAECAVAAQDQKFEQLSQPVHHSRSSFVQRYIITAVVDSYYDLGNGMNEPEKILSVQCERTKLSKAITLRQAWVDTQCTPGSFVHVVGKFDRLGQCIVDNNRNLLILHPDHLISSTVVGDSFTCIRKAVLQERVKATSDANQSTVYGHMLHEIFQTAMKANKWDDAFMADTIETVVSQYLEILFEINIEHAMAVEHLKARAGDLQAWAEVFVAAKPKPNAVVRDRNGAQALMCINKLLEVEEHVWSPAYGLKGNIDATVQIQLKQDDCQKTLTVPFELKTGKHSSAAHKAQTSLYSLLLSDRYDVDIACGILYYMHTSEVSSIRTLRHELTPMIIQRNELASFVRNRTGLPPMLKKPYTCGKCYAQTPCYLYHKLVDNGNGETSGMGAKFDIYVKDLKPEHQHFFNKWDELLTKEERDIVKLRRELWTMHSDEREKVGRCFGGLIIDPGSFHEEPDAPKINRFRYDFVKRVPAASFSFAESQIALGEPIVISDENGHFALANGYVTKVRKHKLQVTVDRRLNNARAKRRDFDADSNQAFLGIMEVVQDGSGSSTQTPAQLGESTLYRLDKDEFSNGMALVRNNLIRLMERDVFGVQALRRLIVEGVPPTFKPTALAYSLYNIASQASLNVDQRAAIEKVMSAKDYALVLGMPGTGKTTTIAHIIRALVAQGKSVLLTSYTHTAVDNILLKLQNDKIGVFRLGAIAKVHPDVQQFADLAGRPVRTVEELKACYTRKVVATTCLGINHPIFNQRIFDYCIVDEASQITLPVCLGPIRMARTFILVGDHYQLPPLVQNKEALEGGLDISLFKMLSDKHPSSVVNLEHQYRMCEDVMTLSNTLIYNGQLKCGTQSVATRLISIPNLAALKQHHHNAQSVLLKGCQRFCPSPSRGTCWLRDLVDPSTKACFVNTDPLLPFSHEVLENGSHIINPCEATLAAQLVESLLTIGLPASEIGVITLYRSQLALLKQRLRHRSGVEMHTADKFQGRDKEAVILSLVRSNEQQIVGDLLKDWRRVNVALTRARTKLLILGSKATLAGNELLKDLIALMDGRGWWYNLPAGACEGHVFEETGTQFSGKDTVELKDRPATTNTPPGRVLNDALGLTKRNGWGTKIPTKQGKFDVKMFVEKRQVLRDIVNDAS